MLRFPARKYFSLKQYNTDFGDLVPLIAAPSLQMHIVICGRAVQRVADCYIVRPISQRSGSSSGPYVVLHLANNH